MCCPAQSASRIMVLLQVRGSGPRTSALALALPPLGVEAGDGWFIHPRLPPMPGDPRTTAELLARIRSGDRSARDVLLARYRPILRGWARGRLPGYARDLAETEDLVQDTLRAALDRLKDFEYRG